MKHPEETSGVLFVERLDSADDLVPVKAARDDTAPPTELFAVADRQFGVLSALENQRDAPGDEIVANGIAVVALVGDQRAGFAERQLDKSVVALAVRRFSANEMESERFSECLTDTENFTYEPAPRTTKRLFASPPVAPAADTWPRTVFGSMP